jgi:glutathione synthase/RimK-type ligase-like ATP-grasp enzyme
MSNDPAAVRAFCEAHGGEIIMKSFMPRNWKSADGTVRSLPATKLRLSQLQHDAAIALCPAIFQNYIAKQFELRVLVAGDEIVAARLNSQACDHSQTDWRTDLGVRGMTIEPYTLGEATLLRIRRFMQAMGLRCGSIDLIVTPDGREVFLEINHQGQFLFLDAMNPAVRTLEAFCRFLASEGGYATPHDWPSYADYLASTAHTQWRKDHLGQETAEPAVAA